MNAYDNALELLLARVGYSHHITYTGEIRSYRLMTDCALESVADLFRRNLILYVACARHAEWAIGQWNICSFSESKAKRYTFMERIQLVRKSLNFSDGDVACRAR